MKRDLAPERKARNDGQGNFDRSEFWEQHDAKLIELIESGATTQQAADALGHGITKNAVIGRARRLGQEWARTNHYRPPPPAPPPAAEFPGYARCCWPQGHPGEPDFHFCGDTAEPGKPYCSTHAARAYIRPKQLGAAA